MNEKFRIWYDDLHDGWTDDILETPDATVESTKDHPFHLESALQELAFDRAMNDRWYLQTCMDQGSRLIVHDTAQDRWLVVEVSPLVEFEIEDRWPSTREKILKGDP